MNGMKHLAGCLLFCAPLILQADENEMSVSISGGKSILLSPPNEYETKEELENTFSEKVIIAEVKKGIHEHVSAFGKAIYYSGDMDQGHQWDRGQQEWIEVESSLDTSGAWIGAGLMANTVRKERLSAGFGLGYGYLTSPKDVHNSGHGQFNVTADLTVKIKDQWSAVLEWNHISNGRRFFGLGEKDSDFYPNNGRDFLTLGAQFQF